MTGRAPICAMRLMVRVLRRNSIGGALTALKKKSARWSSGILIGAIGGAVFGSNRDLLNIMNGSQKGNGVDAIIFQILNFSCGLFSSLVFIRSFPGIFCLRRFLISCLLIGSCKSFFLFRRTSAVFSKK